MISTKNIVDRFAAYWNNHPTHAEMLEHLNQAREELAAARAGRIRAEADLAEVRRLVAENDTAVQAS